jgi:ribosome-associated toxin RatA of RatAB toxin-antitoxin module
MRTVNHITICGDIGRVFELASDVTRWPELLPHYRFVRLISSEGRRRIVEMAAHRDGIPVKWTSVQEPIPEERRILFTHIKGPTKGMEVEWLLEQEQVGDLSLVRVSITHEFNPPWGPVFGKLIAKHVVGGFFVENIAGKTLRRIKEIVEQEAGEKH